MVSGNLHPYIISIIAAKPASELIDQHSGQKAELDKRYKKIR